MTAPVCAQAYIYNSPTPVSVQLTLPAQSAGFHLITISRRHAGSKIRCQHLSTVQGLLL